MKRYLNILLLALFACNAEQESLRIEDYQRAESFLAANTNPLVYGIVSSQSWSDNFLVYRTSVPGGYEFKKTDLQTGESTLAFDHEALAQSLAAHTEEAPDPMDLPISNLTFDEGSNSYLFRVDRDNYQFTSEGTLEKQAALAKPNEFLSPDEQKAAFIRDYNLWVRNTATNEETQLTFDGEEDYGYATNNAGWIKRDSPVLLWSPNSDKIATFQHDGRGVGEMYLWSTKVGHPKLEAWKYPLPGDSLIFRIERVVIHLEPEPRTVRLNIPPDAHRSTISDHIAARNGAFLDVEWSKDQSQLSFVSSSRDHKVAHLQMADVETGEVTSLLREEVPTYFESGEDMVNWHVLNGSNEIVWFSERDNWGHLYLYDLESGQLKNQITSGDWRVMQVHHIDEDARKIYFVGSNKEEGDPYFQYMYRVNFDGSDLVNLTPENMNHSFNWAPSKAYFTDSYSTPATPPVTVIRNLDGEVVAELETADITDLEASGWIPPEPFVVKARDESTDLYGLMYKPTNFDQTKKYPILNYLYPGPQSGSVGSRSFRASRGDKQAVAELGFIVVEVDALGTPGRSKSFHDAYYGNMGDNGLPDQMTMIRQLAARHDWMDLDKIGIWGHSGGGFASTDGILRYPDFYKVAVSGAGNHDNRNYEDDWGEKWQGLLVEYPSATSGTSVDTEVQAEGELTNYDNQANQLLAPNLKGKLLLAHGMLDGNVHPSNTLLVVDALIKADKDFDMVVIPNARHGFGNSRFFLKKRWDYFVRHLKGIEPPEGFIFEDNIR